VTSADGYTTAYNYGIEETFGIIDKPNTTHRPDLFELKAQARPT